MLAHLRRELLSGKKRKAPDENHEESWLVANWPDYVERSFEKAPKDMMSQLRKMIDDKATPKVEAHKVRGQEVKPIDSRPLGDLEFAKLSELLEEYEKKWESMGAMGRALSNQMDANTKGLHGRHDNHDEKLDEVLKAVGGRGMKEEAWRKKVDARMDDVDK